MDGLSYEDAVKRICELQAENRKLKKEVNRLSIALILYGHHTDSCDIVRLAWSPTIKEKQPSYIKCTCGYDEALKENK